MLEVLFISQFLTTDGRRCIDVEAREHGATVGARHRVYVQEDTQPAEAFQKIALQIAGGVPKDDPLQAEIQKWIDSRAVWNCDTAAYKKQVEAIATAEQAPLLKEDRNPGE